MHSQQDTPSLWSRVWGRDRAALLVVAVGSAVAGVLWRFTTQPMGDTPTYRSAAAGLRSGWPHLLERTPGYPIVLLLTGSAERSTVALFCVQLLMHGLCIVLMLDAVRFVGVGRRGRLVVAVLLMAPPVMLRVVGEGTEATAALLMTVLFWLLVVPRRRSGGPEHGTGRRPGGLGRNGYSLGRVAAIGTVCGVLAMVRPTFALVVVPVVGIWAVGCRGGRRGRRVWLEAALVVAPSVLLVGALSLSNGLRFDSYGLTPMLPYHLSSRTSPYVEELPRSYEPGRSVLIAGRDLALLRGESMAPANYIWGTRDELERVTGLAGPDLDRYLLRVQLRLIADNPFGYLDTVRAALSNMTTMDSQPVVLGQGRAVVWAEQLVHLGLSVLFLAAVAVMPGLALARRLSRRSLRFLGVGSLLVGYTVVVSAMVETGTARLRAPVEPILVGLLVVAVSAARAEWAARVARVEDSTHGR